MLSGVMLWPLTVSGTLCLLQLIVVNFMNHLSLTSSVLFVSTLNQLYYIQLNYVSIRRHDKLFFLPSFRVPRLKMVERPPLWTVAANTFNTYSTTADKGSPSPWIWTSL